MSQEGYPDNWVKAVLMINPETKEIHAIGGDREPGEGDTAYIGFELIREWVHGPRKIFVGKNWKPIKVKHE